MQNCNILIDSSFVEQVEEYTWEKEQRLVGSESE
jgi:hypothetical protein